VQVGLVGGATPFLTGHAHTLFLDDATYADGVVGVALRSRGQALFHPPAVSYAHAHLLGQPYTVAQYACGGGAAATIAAAH
jgi:hypothetical protein